METYRKNRLLFWTMIFLVVVNLSALATYFLFPKQPTVVTCGDGSQTPGCSFQSELNLTDEQTRQVEMINSDFREVSRPISKDIKSIRTEVLDELAVDNPDTAKLDNFSFELSRLQGQLHRENMKHYLKLKKVCTPDQAMHLSNLYRELYGCPMQQGGSCNTDKGVKNSR